MQIFVFVLTFLLKFANNDICLASWKASTSQTKSCSTSSLAPSSNWQDSSIQVQVGEDCISPLEPPFEGPHLYFEHHGRGGELPLALHMWTSQWKEAPALSCMQRTLVLRNSTQQCSEITQSPAECLELGYWRSPTIQKKQKTATGSQRKCQEAKRERKRQRSLQRTRTAADIALRC